MDGQMQLDMPQKLSGGKLVAKRRRRTTAGIRLAAAGVGITGGSGLLLMAPFDAFLQSQVLLIAGVHVAAGLLILLPFIVISIRHGRSKRKIRGQKRKKIVGILLAGIVLVTSAVGLMMMVTSAVYQPWFLPVHRIVGACMFVLLYAHLFYSSVK